MVFLQNTNQIVLGDSNYCIEPDIESRKLTLVPCHFAEMKQRWSFGFINKTML